MNALAENRFRQELVNSIYKALEAGADLDRLLRSMELAVKPTILLHQAFDLMREEQP